MTEEPEQVLPQQRITAVFNIEEMGMHEAIEDERGAGEHDSRHGEQHHE